MLSNFKKKNTISEQNLGANPLILMQLGFLREIDFISAQNGLVWNVNFCEN